VSQEVQVPQPDVQLPSAQPAQPAKAV